MTGGGDGGSGAENLMQSVCRHVEDGEAIRWMDCGGSIDPPSVVVVSQSGAIDSRRVRWHALLQAMGARMVFRRGRSGGSAGQAVILTPK